MTKHLIPVSCLRNEELDLVADEDLVGEDCRQVVETMFYIVRELENDVYIEEHLLTALRPFRLNQNGFERSGNPDDGIKAFDRIVEIGIYEI